MKILTIIGARPQFVKAAAVSREIASRPELQEIIVHTGQHFDANMSDIFFEEMHIPKPNYFLNVNSLSHGAMTGKMLEKIEELLVIDKPDLVMVYGDTNSTLAGALAAKKLHIKVIHIEAGLRSYNMRMPEEINRILTDRVSDILCCPTEQALLNLKNEGFTSFPCKIVKTGDVMQDAAMFYQRNAVANSSIMNRLKFKGKPFVLCTIHRAENTDDLTRLTSIFAALNSIAAEKEVILPLHPRTMKIIRDQNLKLDFTPIDPVGYLDMIMLLQHATLVLTDSGGLQKEAFFFRKPCVTLRDETEWVELLNHGCNQLAGSDTESILSAYHTMLGGTFNFDIDLYGNGRASKNVVESLLDSVG